jgi:hypothetical protein
VGTGIPIGPRSCRVRVWEWESLLPDGAEYGDGRVFFQMGRLWGFSPVAIPLVSEQAYAHPHDDLKATED